MSDIVLAEITPALAAEYLAASPEPTDYSQRPATRERFAALMKAGMFKETNAPIVIYTDGIIRDGRLRLNACVEAGVPFTTKIIEGVTNEELQAS